MSDKIPTTEISIIGYQADITSGQHRTNYANIRNRHNALCDTVAAASVGTTNAETSAARPYQPTIGDSLETIGGNINRVISGGLVTELDTPNRQVKVEAFEAVVGGISISRGFASWTRVTTTATVTENNHGLSNGDTIYVDVSSSTAAIAISTEYTVANVTTNTFDITCTNAGDTSGSIEFSRYTGAFPTFSGLSRISLVVVNSDASISLLLGTQGSNVFPAVASTQRPLARINDQPGGNVSNGYIADCRAQGCIVDKTRWYFQIQDAVDSIDVNVTLSGDVGGHIDILAGRYYEEVDIAGKSIITLNYLGGAYHLTPDTTSRCIIADNVSTEREIKILNGIFWATSSTVEVIKIVDVDGLVLKNIKYNTSTSSATPADYVLTSCTNVIMDKPFVVPNYTGTELKGYTEIYSQKVHGNIHGATTYGAIYTALDDIVPLDGDKAIVNGGFQVATAGADIHTAIISYVEKIDGTPNTVRAYITNASNGSTKATTIDFDESDATATNVSIAW